MYCFLIIQPLVVLVICKWRTAWAVSGQKCGIVKLTGNWMANSSIWILRRVREGYGCKTYTARTEEELIEAINLSKKQTVSTLIDIKVLPKTMTHGYESWWRVGVAQVSAKESNAVAYKALKNGLSKSRPY